MLTGRLILFAIASGFSRKLPGMSVLAKNSNGKKTHVYFLGLRMIQYIPFKVLIITNLADVDAIMMQL
jgi:hypothetical protein